MKKLCIFDFDGTLFNTIEDVACCINQALTVYNFPTFSSDEFYKNVGGNLYEIIEKCVGPENCNPETLEMFKDTYLDIAEKHVYDKTCPYEGMVEVLEKLQNDGIIIAINSNRNPESIKFFTQKYMDHIEFIDIQGHVPTNPSKPHPYGVNHILETVNMNVEDAVYIGDSGTDIQTAKNAGVDCILVSWGYALPEDLTDEYLTNIIDTPEELFEVIS